MVLLIGGSSPDLKLNLPFAFAQSQEKNGDVTALKDKLLKIIDLANLVIKDIDDNSLLAYYGLKTDNRPDAAKIKRYIKDFMTL